MCGGEGETRCRVCGEGRGRETRCRVCREGRGGGPGVGCVWRGGGDQV